MQSQQVLWLVAILALAAAPIGAEEPASGTAAEAEPSPASGMIRIESIRSEGEPDSSGTREADGRSDVAAATPPGSVASPQPAVPISASSTTGLDAGPAVMLRCLGADGVFTFGAGSDDFVAWAFSPGPIDLTQPFGLHYRFGVVPPLGEQCRIFREPFPAGVVPPAPPLPPSPLPLPPGGGGGAGSG